MLLYLYVAAVLCLAAPPTAEAARVSVSVNFGWRWSADTPAHGGNAHGPAVNSTAPPPHAKQAHHLWRYFDI